MAAHIDLEDRKVDEPLSPYAMFGDNTATITTQHQKSQDYTLKIPIVEDGIEVGLFEMDMQTGIASMKNNDGDLLARKVLSDEERARFLTVDPMAEKYYSWSPYVYCMNNPVKYVDPTGMWVYIYHGGRSYKYDNGKLYEQGDNGGYSTEYSGDDSTLLGLVDGFNNLSSKSATGRWLTQYFSNDENDISVSLLSQSRAEKLGIEYVNQYSYADNIVYLKDDLSGSLIPTEKGMQNSPFWLDIGHEMGHGLDRSVNGVNAAKGNWPMIMSDEYISNSEVRTTHLENMMRGEAGLPLRSHYATYSRDVIIGTSKNTIAAPYGPSWIINNTGRGRYSGFNYRSNRSINIPNRR